MKPEPKFRSSINPTLLKDQVAAAKEAAAQAQSTARDIEQKLAVYEGRLEMFTRKRDELAARVNSSQNLSAEQEERATAQRVHSLSLLGAQNGISGDWQRTTLALRDSEYLAQQAREQLVELKKQHAIAAQELDEFLGHDPNEVSASLLKEKTADEAKFRASLPGAQRTAEAPKLTAAAVAQLPSFS